MARNLNEVFLERVSMDELLMDDSTAFLSEMLDMAEREHVSPLEAIFWYMSL